MMRSFLFSSVLAVHLSVALYADDVPNPLNPSTRDILFRELMAGLPQKGERANTARLELTYWHERESLSLQKVPDRQFITTKNGDKVEIVFVHSSAMSMPGTDFTMALLLNERRVVDWASCWTYNRAARQKPLLEDVDGDGFVDVAFEYGDGFSGRHETRKHIIPGSNRKWLTTGRAVA